MASGVFALYSIADKGIWPKTWPADLERLRPKARTAVGPTLAQAHYDIPFETKQSFEKAWPHLLKVKSEGAPIFLLRGPNKWLGNTISAGVRIHSPPENSKNPEKPIAGVENTRVRWMHTNYIELIVDGKIVDLNSIPLPGNTPIIDERFLTSKKP